MKVGLSAVWIAWGLGLGGATTGLIAGLIGGMLVSRPAMAARGATVDVDQTELHEAPNSKSKVLDKLAKGTPLAASNQPLEGYYKVRTSAGVIGFVSADSLMLQAVPPPDDPEAAAAANPVSATPVAPVAKTSTASDKGPLRKHLRFKALGGYNFFSAGDVNNLLQATIFQFGFSAGGEFDFIFTPDLAMVIRLERVFKSAFARDVKTLSTFQMDLSSIPFMIGAEVTLTKGKKITTHATLMGGLGMQTDLSSTSLNDAAPNVTDMSAQAFTAVLKGDVTYSFNETWSVFAEAGYRYLKTVSITPDPTTVPNGSQIFRDPVTQSYAALKLDLSGPFLGVGLGISF